MLSVPGAAHHVGSAGSFGIDLVHDLPIVLVIALVVLWYARGVRSINSNPATAAWPPKYTWMFMCGLGTVLAVTTGPLAYAAMSLFSTHMVQHLALMMVATPLIVMGAPVLLLLRSSSSSTRKKYVVPVFRSSAFDFITNPVLTWFAFAMVLVGVHFTPVMTNLMEFSPWGRYCEYALYLFIAFCYYYPLLPGNPARNRPPAALAVMSLFLMMIPETMTGFFIYSAGLPLVPYFVDPLDPNGISSLNDQRLGGALMWSTSMIIDVIWIAVAVQHWFGTEVIKTRRLDIKLAQENAEFGK